ncbi:hypothetical protein DW1_1580 [Proteiniborus sp. DW1]|uniref:Gfo/Idh/MocA family protein n=1 Tax=Proteiniborus sp. DW1 TaxID=1889883 RepID=UPI00092E145B|nr:Gfo/Idh/MocA family oxidoreductase [Proteiniborus sp. DW1]SCG83150.1 hypothetical protein DW1_1580 [Proteiniborus sp. DW1]
MKCVVVGFGSIGKRHAKVLNELQCKVAVVSKREVDFPIKYTCLYDALINEKPDYIVIANETYKHYDSLVEIAKYGFDGVVLVEKPLFHTTKPIPKNAFKQVYVGYNLRFHPILQKVFKIIRNEKVFYVQVYVGQYLPYWRPERDYRENYSAKKKEGGGVLLDLSHELDYLNWFFHDWKSIVAIGGKYSSLQIDSEDMYSLILDMEKCPVAQVHFNYLDRISRRELTIITENYSIKADLVQQTLNINQRLIKYDLDYDYTYYMQHKAIIDRDDKFLCTIEEGLKIIEMINCIEGAAKESKWIKR